MAYKVKLIVKEVGYPGDFGTHWWHMVGLTQGRGTLVWWAEE